MSARFVELYNALPQEAQQILIEKHLAGLFDAVSKEKSKKVMLAATRLQTKYSKIPQLDLRAKKKQIGELLEELARDAKTAIVPERSHRDELLAEIIQGLLSWLNVIWSVAYEHNVQFATAHRCLLFVAEALIQLSERSTLGGCKCAFINLPVDFTLRDKNGKVLKHFSLRGPQKMDRILLWIWRDLFVSLFAGGSKNDKASVPVFLEEIQDVLGLFALERLLSGGRPSDDDDDDDDDDNWEEDYEDYDEEEEEDEDTDCSGSDDSDTRCSCKLHAKYWTEIFNKERLPLRACVERRLFAVFKQTPSLRLFRALTSINLGSDRRIDELFEVLQENAGSSPDNLVAALDIYVCEDDFDQIVELLQKHTHLLRPRDMVTLQCAVGMLALTPHRQLAMTIFEDELQDSFQAIYIAVCACFAHVEEKKNKAELAEILKLERSAPGRKTRIESWVENAISSSNAMGPMTLAAMMMGLPLVAGSEDGEDSDVLNYVDLDGNDSDFDDLRDEFRPDLKARFYCWVQLGQNRMGGGKSLLKLYAKAVDLMPYLRSQDIINEMVARLRQKGPGKQHVLEALSNLGTFTRIQRKKMNVVAEKKQQNAKQTAGVSGANGSQSKSTNRNKKTPPARGRTTQDAFRFGRPSSKFSKVPGGIEDVD